jgi:hypothetical protein
VSDLDEEAGSASRSRDSLTPLPSPVRPSSEDIAFAALSDLDEDDEPASQAAASPSASPAASPALPRPSSPPAAPRPSLPPAASRASSPALPRESSPPAVSPADEQPKPSAGRDRPISGHVTSQDPSASRSGKKAKRSTKRRSGASAPTAAGPVAVAAIQPPPRIDDVQAPDLMLSSRGKRGFGSLLWLILVVGAAGTLIWVVRNQMSLREQAEEQAQANEARQQELLRSHLAAQPKSGRIAVESEPAEAAVWMLLGRTPLETEPFSASMVHELRLELDGYAPQDVRVAGTHWRGEEDSPHAEVSARLAPGTPERPLPAYPPEPSAEAMQGLREGQGSIHVTSEPPGAQVWLLVGITPGVEIMATAGADYELEVVKDGYLPGIVVVRAADWQKAGDQSVERSVTLQRQPKKR